MQHRGFVGFRVLGDFLQLVDDDGVPEGTVIAHCPSMSDRLFVLAQYALPKQAITSFAGLVANSRYRPAVTRLIAWFVQRYGVDMSEAEQSDISQFQSFNHFFTRALRPGIRPIAASDLICPVDGAISQFGRLVKGSVLQAKGRSYGSMELLGGDAALAAPYASGSFATIYLSPRDYHRIHMPCDGRLLRMIHVPGELFSVNPATARGVPNLFARNERVVCFFEDPAHRPFVMVLVGATIVGSMSTVWHGVVNAPRRRTVTVWNYQGDSVLLARGEEMGRFQLGSTVVMLFPDDLAFNPEWVPAGVVRLGQAMADRSR